MALVRFFSRYYRRYVWWAALAVLTIPVYGITSTAVVALIEPIFSDVLMSSSGGPASSLGLGSPAESATPGTREAVGLKALADRAYRQAKEAAGVDGASVVFFTPLLLFVVFALRGAADFWGTYAFQRIGMGITTDIRNDVHRRLLDQDVRFHAERPSAELVSRVISDISLIQNALSSRLFDIGQQSITLVLLLALLFSTDTSLALTVLVAAPVFIALLTRFSRAARGASRASQARMADVTAVLMESLRSHPVVKAFRGEHYEDTKFRSATARHMSMSLRGQRLSTLSSVVIETTAIATTSLFLMYAGLRVRSGALSVALLVQFIANVWLLYDPVRKLNSANMALQPLIAVGQRVMAVMEAPISVVDRPEARPLDGFRDRIAFDQVSVSYGGRKVVDAVSFEIARGEVVALVGASGAGKTTLASLLPRFFDPDEGRVTIDGHDLRDVTVASLRSLIGIVTQHTLLFDDTIRNNIAYGQPDVPLEAVERAAAAAYAAAFITVKPEGYDAPVGEGGQRLSGGERQRIAIARALLKDAPILVLDEATSQLDSQSEAIVHRALYNLMQGRTVLVVAHHLATIQQADRIVVLDKGAVVETGRHEELLAKGSTYRRLFDHWKAEEREHQQQPG